MYSKYLGSKEIPRKVRFSVVELMHIALNGPLDAGDTLSGGEAVANLNRLGFIKRDAGGDYIVSEEGKNVLRRIAVMADRLHPAISIDVAWAAQLYPKAKHAK